MSKIKLAIAGIFVAITSYLIGCSSNIPTNLGMTSRSQASCTTYVQSTSVIGNQSSVTILAAHPNRAWARINVYSSATNTMSLSFDDGAAATNGSGTMLNSTSSLATNTFNEVIFGLNTDHPYNGTVTGITNLGSTTINVEECIF